MLLLFYRMLQYCGNLNANQTAEMNRIHTLLFGSAKDTASFKDLPIAVLNNKPNRADAMFITIVQTHILL